MMHRRLIAIALASALAAAADGAAAQQTQQTAPPPPAAPAAAASSSGRLPIYKPPLRGAPGGRIGGASRSAAIRAGALPDLETLAPEDGTGLTAVPDPTLYYFISRASSWPMEFTISAPLQPAPVVEVTIPAPAGPGIYPISTAAYRVHLQPGIVYTWSVAVVADPTAWSHNAVASATIEVDPGRTPPAGLQQSAAALAQAGLWYDAVAAAAAARNTDRGMALDSLMQQVGLTAAIGSDRSGSPR